MKPECISTSRGHRPRAAVAILALWTVLVSPLHAFAQQQGSGSGSGGSGGGSSSTDRTTQPEEDDYQSTPFTEYGEFNEATDEDEDTKFFQSGRFFGVSLGGGLQGVVGNRGLLWKGGFPLVDFRVHYWFDYNFALSLGFYLVSHFYEADPTTVPGGRSTVNFSRVGMDLRYYFPMQNVTAAIAWLNPYAEIGLGSYSKTETAVASGLPDSDSAFGLAAGGGLELVIVPRKTYFQINAKAHFMNFKDTDTSRFQDDQTTGGIPDLTGFFYTVSGSVMFTW